MSYVDPVSNVAFRCMSDAPRDGTFIFLYLANQIGRYLAAWDAESNVWRGETYTIPATLPIAWVNVADPWGEGIPGFTLPDPE